MRSFTTEVEYNAGLDEVMSTYWQADTWPQVAEHVRGLDIEFEEGNVQVLNMKVLTRGRLDSFKSVRTRHENSIFYIQPTPPTLLEKHFGWWRFEIRDGKTVVVSEHCVEVALEPARRFLEASGGQPQSDVEVEDELQKIITNNSLQTMRVLKNRLEAEGGVNHEQEKEALVS